MTSVTITPTRISVSVVAASNVSLKFLKTNGPGIGPIIINTGNPGPPGTGLNAGSKTFAVAGAGPYALGFTPNGFLSLLFLDGRVMNPSDYSIAGSNLTLLPSLDPSNYVSGIFIGTK